MSHHDSNPPQILQVEQGIKGHSKAPAPSDINQTVVVIDTHRFSRECLLRVLQEHSSARVNSYASIDQWFGDPQAGSTALIILCQYGRSHEEALAEVHRLSGLASQVGNCAIVIMSNNEDPDFIVK